MVSTATDSSETAWSSRGRSIGRRGARPSGRAPGTPSRVFRSSGAGARQAGPACKCRRERAEGPSTVRLSIRRRDRLQAPPRLRDRQDDHLRLEAPARSGRLQFVRNGVVVSRTFDRSTTRATFWKGFHYAVDLLRVSAGKRVIPFSRAVAYTKPLGWRVIAGATLSGIWIDRGLGSRRPPPGASPVRARRRTSTAFVAAASAIPAAVTFSASATACDSAAYPCTHSDRRPVPESFHHRDAGGLGSADHDLKRNHPEPERRSPSRRAPHERSGHHSYRPERDDPARRASGRDHQQPGWLRLRQRLARGRHMVPSAPTSSPGERPRSGSAAIRRGASRIRTAMRASGCRANLPVAPWSSRIVLLASRRLRPVGIGTATAFRASTEARSPCATSPSTCGHRAATERRPSTTHETKGMPGRQPSIGFS